MGNILWLYQWLTLNTPSLLRRCKLSKDAGRRPAIQQVLIKYIKKVYVLVTWFENGLGTVPKKLLGSRLVSGCFSEKLSIGIFSLKFCLMIHEIGEKYPINVIFPRKVIFSWKLVDNFMKIQNVLFTLKILSKYT